MLNNVPLFTGLEEAELIALEKLSEIKTFPKKSVVIRKGEMSDALYIILSGKVEIYFINKKGKEVVFNTQGFGSHFGELGLLGGTARTASVITLEDSSFLIISKNTFLKFLQSNPTISLNLIRGLVERVTALSENVSNLALLDTYGRLAKLILENASEEDGELITEELTQQDIANRIGSSREMVNRILKDLREGEYISTKGKRIIIHKNLPARW